jgi:hypothetical protein
VRRVPLATIGIDDERYRFTRGQPDAALRDSIAAWGCLVPPIVVALADHSDTAVPIAGFRRLAVLAELAAGRSGRPWVGRQAGEDETRGGDVEVRWLSAETPPCQVFSIAIADAAREGELGPFEVCRAAGRALEMGVARGDVISRLLPLFGLEPHSVVLKRHLKLERIPDDLAHYLERKGVNLRRALNFVSLEPKSAAVLVELAERLHLSARATEEWAKMMGDVARRDGLTWPQVAQRAGLLDADEQASQDLPLSEQVKRGRQRLWALRYPTWHSVTEAATRAVEVLDLPPRARVHWDPQFERDGITLELSVRDVGELREDLRALGARSRLRALGDLLDLV